MRALVLVDDVVAYYRIMWKGVLDELPRAQRRPFAAWVEAGHPLMEPLQALAKWRDCR